MSRAGVLLQLQNKDTEMDSQLARLRAVDAALGESAAVQAAERELLEAEAGLHAARVALQSLEYDGQTLQSKIAEVSDRAYSGSVTNPKELQDIQRDLESLQRRRAALEEQQFEALVGAEAAEVRATAARHALKTAETEASHSQGTLREQRDAIQQLLDEMRNAREPLLSIIPAADRDLYDRLRRAKNGRAVTQLEDGACASCGVAPSSSRIQDARQGADLILCGNCGRILAAD